LPSCCSRTIPSGVRPIFAAGRSAAAVFVPVLIAVLVSCALAPAFAAERVGSESCKTCHATAYRIWRASPHAKASENLTPAQRDDMRCAHCHAPEKARSVQETAPFQKPERLANQVEGGVACESCHGAGQFYTPNYVMRDAELSHAVGLLDPGQKSCLVCHSADSPSLSPFDFASKVKLIDHWTQDRQQRRGSASAAPEPSVDPQETLAKSAATEPAGTKERP
jgi:hypothetical protein